MNASDVVGSGLTWLWRATWQASVLVLLVLLAQWLFRSKLTPQSRHAFWWLVLIRLLLPVVPATPFSIFNFARVEPLAKGGTRFESVLKREYWDRGRVSSQDRLHQGPASGSPGTPPASAQAPNGSSSTPASLPTPALPPSCTAVSPAEYALWGSFGIWLSGVLFLGGRLIWGNCGFARRLRRRSPIGDPDVRALLEECRQVVGVRQPLGMVETPEVDSPALFGCFRVKLLLPPRIATTFSRAELRHVFLHELAHVRRGDVPTNWLMALLQIVHWFNPAIWFALSRMRADRCADHAWVQ